MSHTFFTTTGVRLPSSSFKSPRKTDPKPPVAILRLMIISSCGASASEIGSERKPGDSESGSFLLPCL